MVGWKAWHLPGHAPSPASPTDVITYRRLAWEDLVPKDWDPLKRYKQLNATDLREGDPRERALIEEMREVWDNAPTLGALDGAHIRLSGYVVPLDPSPSGLREFLLVPYFGACIHTPPPPANQIVHVRLREPGIWKTMEPVQVSGTLVSRRRSTSAGMSGYALEADEVRAFSSAFLR